ncbi:UNVERIFIED_ORG: hypothetical protein ABIB63_000570 [Xanthomonas axonopodis]
MSLGLAALSFFNWFQLPRKGWFQVSATPSTLCSAENALV